MMPYPKPPCLLCGEVLYDPTSVTVCLPCGGRHDALCVICVAKRELTTVAEIVRKPHGRLLVCPDAIRVVAAMMIGEGDDLDTYLRVQGRMG